MFFRILEILVFGRFVISIRDKARLFYLRLRYVCGVNLDFLFFSFCEVRVCFTEKSISVRKEIFFFYRLKRFGDSLFFGLGTGFLGRFVLVAVRELCFR